MNSQAREGVRRRDDQTHRDDDRRDGDGEAVPQELLEVRRVVDAVCGRVEHGEFGRVEHHGQIRQWDVDRDAVGRDDQVTDHPDERLERRVLGEQRDAAGGVQRRARPRERGLEDPVDGNMSADTKWERAQRRADGLQRFGDRDLAVTDLPCSVDGGPTALDGRVRDAFGVLGDLAEDGTEEAHASSTPSASLPRLTFSHMNAPMKTTATMLMAAPRRPYAENWNASR